MGFDANYSNDANAVSPGREVFFNMKGSSPPTAAYLGVDDSLWITAMSSVQQTFLTVSYRLLMPDGTIIPNQQNIVVPAGRFPNWFQFNLPECFILGITITSGHTDLTPYAYANAIISRGNPVLGVISQVLCQGYPDIYSGISWPNGVNVRTTDARGYIYSITGTTPAAGAEISETVPLNAQWNLTSFSMHFAASAAVANRIVSLVIDDGVNNLQQLLCTVTIVASQGWVITWGKGLLNVSQAAASLINQALPKGLILQAGWRIRTFTVGLQAGDQWNQVEYAVEEWISL